MKTTISTPALFTIWKESEWQDETGKYETVYPLKGESIQTPEQAAKKHFGSKAKVIERKRFGSVIVEVNGVQYRVIPED